MPAAPKFCHGFGHIGVIKVFNEVKAKNLTQTDGHIRIAGEIKVDVQHKANGVHPVEHHRGFGRFPENREHQCNVVCNDDFLAQADQEAAHTQISLFQCMGTALQLPCHVNVAHNRTGNQLRKQRNVSTKSNRVLLCGHIVAVHINGIAQALEGVEADADGQCQLQQLHIQTGQFVEVVNKEVCVFEHTQRREAQRNRYDQPDSFPALGGRLSNSQTAQPEHQNRANHQKYIHRLSPTVKQQAKQQKYQILGKNGCPVTFLFPLRLKSKPHQLGYQEITDNHCRQEIVKKRDT